MKVISSAQQDPITIVIYGVTGVGKSCLAREICSRIPNCYIFPTDMLRNVLARYTQDSIIRESSYAITHKVAVSNKDKSNLIDGFKRQNKALSKAIRGVIEWSRITNNSLIIEGINASGYMSKSNAVERCYRFLVVCGDDTVHLDMLKKRHAKHPSPPISLAKYNRYFSNIRFMQEYLIKEAVAKEIEVLDPFLIGTATATAKVFRSINIGGKCI